MTDKTIMDVVGRHRSICWYPSAGSDFRPLTFLNPFCYEDLNIPKEEEQVFPDLFIMTDVFPQDCNYSSGFPDKINISRLNDEKLWKEIKKLYHDTNTDISVITSERLKDLDLELDVNVLSSEYRNRENYGKVFCFETKIRYRRYGSREEKEWNATVVYAIAENRVFARDVLLKNGIGVDYIPVIRYGNSIGGGSSMSPDWIRSCLGALRCKYYICNPQYTVESEDLEYFSAYRLPPAGLSRIKIIDEKKWSSYADIIWHKVLR